ncbi:hypothetical protein BB8028_0001g04600 [Beauveria bassiana]|uniref:Uncharacterized protein n=1 Tax=Beauveria bassiana TaxID=176275 RepID=A0A2S7XXK0_BEABA|nr:hypothetical protein BB8028_0001g04600 [Beauveria bassiana]
MAETADSLCYAQYLCGVTVMMQLCSYGPTLVQTAATHTAPAIQMQITSIKSAVHLCDICRLGLGCSTKKTPELFWRGLASPFVGSSRPPMSIARAVHEPSFLKERVKDAMFTAWGRYKQVLCFPFIFFSLCDFRSQNIRSIQAVFARARASINYIVKDYNVRSPAKVASTPL